MTITIDIHLHPEDGDIAGQLDTHMAALGFARQRPGYAMQRVLTGTAEVDHQTMLEEDAKARAKGKNLDGSERRETSLVSEVASNTPTRERGKPSPGKARRTKEEIAEDEMATAAEASGVQIASMTILPDDSTPTQVAEAFASIKGAISETPEDRRDPANPDDSPEDQAQDAADEAAETAQVKAETGGKLTLDDIRTVLGNYQKTYGLPATMTDGPAVLQEVCGEGIVKVSSVPDDKIADVIAALKAAGRSNRFKRTAVAS